MRRPEGPQDQSRRREKGKKEQTVYGAAPREALRDTMLEMDRRLAIRKKKIKNEALLGRNLEPKKHCL